MAKRIAWISTSLLLMASVVYIVIYFQGLKQYGPLNLIKAVPENTSILLVANDLSETVSHIEMADSLIANLDWISTTQALKNLLAVVKKHNWSEKYHLSALNGPIAVSIDIDKEPMAYTFYYGFFDVQTERKYSKLLSSAKGVFKSVEMESDIFQISIDGLPNKLFASISDGIFILSTSQKQVREALNQASKSSSLLNDDSFKEALKTVSKEAIANLLVNLPIFDSIVSEQHLLQKDALRLSEWGKWAALDIDASPTRIGISGILTPVDGNKKKAYALFDGLSPAASQLIGMLPVQTAMAKVYHFGPHPQLVQNALQTYLDKNPSSFRNDSLLGIIESEIALAHVQFDTITDRFLVCETSSYSRTLDNLKELLAQHNGDDLKPETYFSPSANAQTPIFKAFENNELSNTLTFLFKKSPDKYFAIHGTQLIFADSVAPLTRYLHQKALDRTLGNTPIFGQYIKGFPTNGHLHFFVSPWYLPQSTEGIVTEKHSIQLKNASSKLSNFYGCGLQLSYSDNTLFLSQNLMYAPNREQDPITIWQSKLDSSVVMKPLMVVNPKTQEREFLVQDQSNMLYLIGSKGIELWTKKIDAPINGDIQTIDFYGNKKTQFAFSAGDAIHVIDYNGNNVGKFPIRLPSKATNPLSVFDYEQNGDYRFFVACDDKSILVFNKHGNRLSDWLFANTETNVTLPIQHFTADGKDFIVVTDHNRYYFLDRKGKERLNAGSLPLPQTSFVAYQTSSSSVTLLTITAKGELLKLSLPSGKAQKSATEILPKGNVALKVIEGQSPQLLCKDDKGVVLMDADGSVVWEKNFPEGIMGVPDIYNFGKPGRKIGLSTKANKIYLFNLDGSVYPGFPLIGISRFSIGYASPENNNFSLVVGGKNHFFYNYEVKSTVGSNR